MKQILTLLIISMVFSGCSIWKGVGENLGDGLMESFEQRDSLLSSMGGNITKGARDSIINEQTKENINKLLDSVIINLSQTSSKNLSMIVDSILGEVLQTRLRQIGETTNIQLAQLRNELLGENTASRISKIRDELLGDTTLNRVANLRNELLGIKTQTMIDSLIYSALDALMVKYNEIQPRLSKDLREETGFIQKHASALLWTAGGIIIILAIVVGYIIIKGNKLKRVSELLTLQINKIPNQQIYDEVTSNIKAMAQEESLEPTLRKILDKQGLLNDPNWKKGIAT
ncbi:MAG: hypothetical protein ABI550_01645 [Ignavibacteriaceae bacterium]